MLFIYLFPIKLRKNYYTQPKRRLCSDSDTLQLENGLTDKDDILREK